MTDFYADLRSELMAAAERDARPAIWRLPRRVARPVLVAAMASAAVAAAVAIAATTGREAEREAGPALPAAASTGGCNDPGEAPVRGEEPAAILSKLGIMRRPASPQDDRARQFRLRGPQLVRVYEDAVRYAGRQDEVDVVVVGAEVVSRAAMMAGPHCETATPPGLPGACLFALGDGGALQVCFTIDEICAPERSKPWMIRNGPGVEARGGSRLIGMAPDGVERVVFDLGDRRVGSLPVRDNVFAGWIDAGPHELDARGTMHFEW